jgi:hypothetical protein
MTDQDCKDTILVGVNSQKEESKIMELQTTQATNSNFLHNEFFVPNLSEKSDQPNEQVKSLQQLEAKKTFSRYLETCGDCV